MSDFDDFCSDLLEQAKRYLEKIRADKNACHQNAYKNACLLLTVCALEAYINGISDEITLAPNFPILLKGTLLEKEVKLVKGDFKLTENLKMSRLTEKIEILYKRHKRKVLNDQENWWLVLQSGIDIRNKLTHPKEKLDLSEEFLKKVLKSVIDCISCLYLCIYKREFPKKNLDITSRLDF
jgi:hypothetical protein